MMYPMGRCLDDFIFYYRSAVITGRMHVSTKKESDSLNQQARLRMIKKESHEVEKGNQASLP